MLSLFNAIRNGELVIVLYYIIARCIVVFVCLPVHELCHGLAAYKFGDDTAKKLGRLTFNPFAHLDPIGTLMIFFFGIGYAKPVPINPMKFKDSEEILRLPLLRGRFQMLQWLLLPHLFQVQYLSFSHHLQWLM